MCNFRAFICQDASEMCCTARVTKVVCLVSGCCSVSIVQASNFKQGLGLGKWLPHQHSSLEAFTWSLFL